MPYFCYNFTIGCGILTKREYRFDFLRAFSMCLVIVIHVANCYCNNYNGISNLSYLGSVIYNVISRISVPLFFMISGALLLKKPFDKNKYLNRIKKFIIIIICWDIIYLLWEYLYLGITYNKLYILVLEPYRKHLWFLYTIIVLYAIQPLLNIMLSKMNKKQITLMYIVIFIICNICMIVSSIASYFTLLCYIGYFMLGDTLYRHTKDLKFKHINWLLISIFITTIILDIIFSYYISIKYNAFINIYFSYRESFIILASTCFFIFIMNNYKNEENKIVTKLSEYSFGIYLIHGIFLDIVKSSISIYLLNSFIGIPLFSIIIFILSYISIHYLKKIPIVNKYLI